ncbi:predicted protein [Histoplasma capsulatum var. duboisii H88]|uniref:Predicted protein n=2 Tax=Ajellomyces capsulatus TaxID=5037 RepID=F0U9Q7_AJEC8|nr:predicted protein [Histoplasma capsulatum H143]EGC41946.1 predicted protein [Histoplasma capsulatum var. duboisii H88]
MSLISKIPPPQLLGTLKYGSPRSPESVKCSSPMEVREFERMLMEANPQGVSQSLLRRTRIIRAYAAMPLFVPAPLATTFEPDDSSVLPRREALAALEFKNRYVSAVSVEQLVEDRIWSLELRLAP